MAREPDSFGIRLVEGHVCKTCPGARLVAGYWGDASRWSAPTGTEQNALSTVSGTTERSDAGRDVNGVSFTSSL